MAASRDTMHSVVVATALMALVLSAVAQIDVCSPNLDQSQWVWKKNFARRRDRRDAACAAFRVTYPNGPSQTRPYAGDPENCRAYFSCHVRGVQDWFHLCPAGIYFDDTTGDCNMLLPDPKRCAKYPQSRK